MWRAEEPSAKPAQVHTGHKRSTAAFPPLRVQVVVISESDGRISCLKQTGWWVLTLFTPQHNLDFNVGLASPPSTSLVLAAIHLYLSAAMTSSLKHSPTNLWLWLPLLFSLITDASLKHLHTLRFNTAHRIVQPKCRFNSLKMMMMMMQMLILVFV